MSEDRNDFIAAFAIGALLGIGATLLLAPPKHGAGRVLHEIEPALRRARKGSRRVREETRKVAREFGKRGERALDAARLSDESLARGNRLGSLHGVPMTIKEAFDVSGLPTTWGVPAQRNNIVRDDATAVEQLKAAGAHFLGKTNVPLNLADWQSYNDIYGTTNNPWNTARSPGGSSGGSAAALAAGLAVLPAAAQADPDQSVAGGGTLPAGWRARTERNAGRALFEALEYRKILPAMGGMSGADISEILRKALETKVHEAARTSTASLVSTGNLLDAIDDYKRVRSVVEKIRYGQYL